MCAVITNLPSTSDIPFILPSRFQTDTDSTFTESTCIIVSASVQKTSIYDTVLAARLKSESMELSSFTFPTNFTQTYSIGPSGKNDIVLPLHNGKVPSAAIHVENAQIEIENISTPSSFQYLTIDDEPVLTKRRIKLQLASEVKVCFGPFVLRLDYVTAVSINFAKKLCDLTKCVVCGEFWKDPFPLPCGHVTCYKCCLELEEMVVYKADLVNVLKKCWSEWPTMECPKCFSTISCEEIIRMTKLPVLTTIVDIFSRLCTNYRCCDTCENSRCVFGLCDFWICGTCESILCPVCALENHRDHETTYVYSLMVENLTTYRNKSCIVKKNFYQINKDRKKFYSYLNVALRILQCCQTWLRKIYQYINDASIKGEMEYGRLLILEKVLDVETFWNIRQETWRNFENILRTLEKGISDGLTVCKITAEMFDEAGRLGNFQMLNFKKISDDIIDNEMSQIIL